MLLYFSSPRQCYVFLYPILYNLLYPKYPKTPLWIVLRRRLALLLREGVIGKGGSGEFCIVLGVEAWRGGCIARELEESIEEGAKKEAGE